MRSKLVFSLLVFGIIITAVNLLAVQPVSATRSIVFPVIGSTSYSNDYNAPRANGLHHAIDIIGNKHQRLVSTVNGTVVHVAYPQPYWGYSVTVEDDAGYRYRYIHMNNDNPGTDDGRGGGHNAYAQDMKVGNRVSRGQLVGYMGDSGNAEDTVSHVHFEIFKPNGDPMNPYWSLNAATRVSKAAIGPKLSTEILPYGTKSHLNVSLAAGNLDVDSASELLTGGGERWAPIVKVYNNGSLLRSFYAYEASFKGGIDVAAGDVDGDGTDEIIAGKGKGGTAVVNIFEANGTKIGTFLAWGTIYKNGIKVAAGDVDGDGTDEIIVGVAKGLAHVRAFELNGTKIGDFYAHGTAFKGGVDVAGGDVTGTSTDEIITGIGATGLPRVKVFNLNGSTVGDFYAYNRASRAGVNVSVDNVRTSTTKDEILTVTATDGPPLMKLFAYQGSSISTNPLDQEMFIEEWWRGGIYDAAAGNDTSWGIVGGNRRPSIRSGAE